MNAEGTPAGAEGKIAELLKRFLALKIDATSLKIHGLHRTPYGYSCENWPFDLRWTGSNGEEHLEKLILRRDATAPVLKSDRAVEFEILRALEGYDSLPTPRARWLDGDGAHFGRPASIMERCPGSCDPLVLSLGESPPTAKLGLARKLMDAVVAIHAFDWRKAKLDQILPAPSAASAEAATSALEHWEGEFRQTARASYPEFEFVMAWLSANVPVSRHVSLVHGDFKPGNALIEDDELVAVLDWETAHLGDPLEDLAWVTNPLRAGEHQIPGVWDEATMLQYYRSASGRAVDVPALHWWGVLANFKLLTISLTAMSGFLNGQADRPMGDPRYYLPFLLRSMDTHGGN
jgi:aminoglycoside phosphotransferase (APT) family kinase protein